MEVTEGNKLIAEFMGYKDEKYYYTNGKESLGIDAMNYHTSWDWIMPVVEKIESMGHAVSIEKFICTIWNRSYNGGIICCNKGTDNKKQVCFRAVIQFIEWYNLNKGK